VIQASASSLGMEVSPLNVRDAGEIERDMTAFARSANSGLIVLEIPLTVVHRDLIIVSNRSKALFLPRTGAGRDRAKAQDGERLGVRRIKGFQCQFREGDLDRCAEHGHGAEKRQHAALCSEL
jgi:hypothetical protein